MLGVLAAAAVLAGAQAATPAARPTVVVAVADTGVNPYHRAFYRPENTAHPCTWVEGFTDCSVPALPLSVGQYGDVATAFAADEHLWAAVQQHRWYWIPRTNIIGAVCDLVVGGGVSDQALTLGGPTACIFDENGHGTGTASAVLSEAPDALLLVHEGNSGAYDLARAPVVPDVQSHSWGPAVPLPLQVLRATADDVCRVGEARPQTVVFLAAGNETPMPTLLDCSRARPEIQVVGGGYPGYWQANSWTVYDFASWFCRPVADSTSVVEEQTACGTSFAAPSAAGTAAAALLRVRQQEGFAGRSTKTHVSRSLTREAFLEALRTAASYAPQSKFPGQTPCLDALQRCFYGTLGAVPLPPAAPYVFWGYGWLDGSVTDAVVACALRTSCTPKAPDAVAYNTARQQARTVTSLSVLGSTRADDTESGRDAGNDTSTALPVVPGASYRGGVHSVGDWRDAYVLRARAGQRLTVSSSSERGPARLGACWAVLAPDGTRLTPATSASFPSLATCDPGAADPAGLRLPQTGAYTLRYESYVTQDYRFSVALD